MPYDFPPIPERIQWHEGMLLAPQHFQLSQARADAQVAWQVLAAQPLAWGLRHLDIDTELLGAGLLRVLALEAVMPDGTAVWHDGQDAEHGTLELALKPHMNALAERPLDLWLTLPRARRLNDPSQPGRFVALDRPPVEDEVSDAAPADLPRLRPRLGLALGEAPASSLQRLRLGQLVRGQGPVRLGDALAPRLVLPRQAPQWQRAWALAAQLRSKATFLARQALPPGSRVEDRLEALEQKERLRAMVTALSPLEAVLQAPQLHPWALYLALCQALGPLALLRADAVPMLAPAYDHADATAAFAAVLDALEEAAAQVSAEHRLLPFTWREDRFERALPADYAGGVLVVGLRGQSERDLQAWMAGAVIGAAEDWSSLRDRRVLGLARRRIEAAPELGLRHGGGYALFELSTQPPGSSAPVPAPGATLRMGNANDARATPRPAEIELFVKG